MNYESFIAKKILTGRGGSRRLTNPVIRIAIAGIALGVAVMIVAVMVVTGFRKEITEKVIGFGSHIRVSHFDSNNSYEEIPVLTDSTLKRKLERIKGVTHIQEYATKAGIIKTSDEIQGVVLKGIASDFDTRFLQNKLRSGAILNLTDSTTSTGVMISRKLSDALGFAVGDEMIVYFIEQPPRIRKLTVSGIYETGLDEFDQLYVFCDIRLIRRLNNWTPDQSGGLELLISNFNNLESVTEAVYQAAGYQYTTQNIREQFPQIFHWLDLQNINVVIIITLILLIAGISMISTLLIIILDNSVMIGVLKAVGAGDRGIRKIFIYVAMPVIGTGILAGNILGVGLCLLQMKTGWFTLPQESYYVSQVPVNLSWFNLALLNAGTIAACLLMLIGPSVVIARIAPSKVIRFD